MAANSNASAVVEILGFDPVDFLQDVSSAIDRQLVIGVGEMQKELKAIALQKGYKAITDAKLSAACQRLLESMRRHFSKNSSKFELYASRNIFTFPEKARSSGLSNGSDAEQEAELAALKQQYTTLQESNTKLASDVGDAETLLREMRASLFNIRVGAQVLDEKLVQPLTETLAALSEKKNALTSLCNRANELASEISGAPKVVQMEPDSTGGTGVKYASAVSMTALTASMRK